MTDELDLPPPSDELRSLYRNLRPPPLADGVEGADPETARVVRWMQGAWRGLAPPRAIVPPARVRRAPLPARQRPRTLAAAAIVLVLAGAALWRALARIEEAGPARLARSESAPARVEIVDVRPYQIELRSGPVRLLLLDPTPSPSEPGS